MAAESPFPSWVGHRRWTWRLCARVRGLPRRAAESPFPLWVGHRRWTWRLCARGSVTAASACAVCYGCPGWPRSPPSPCGLGTVGGPGGCVREGQSPLPRHVHECKGCPQCSIFPGMTFFRESKDYTQTIKSGIIPVFHKYQYDTTSGPTIKSAPWRRTKNVDFCRKLSQK